MGTILSLLAVLGVATAVISIGLRISLYFYRQDALGMQPFVAQSTQATSTQQAILERSELLYRDEAISGNSRLAFIFLAFVAIVILLAILLIAGMASGFVP
ncbi:MAG TPA: hypothetical protein VGT44_22820 [Ktedonobacteraceae bacterium]|nr:hypothetical protein [Ktedonobacteraceae bacterium]